MVARVKGSSLDRLGSLESENRDIAKGESISEEPDFKSLLEQVDKLEGELEAERKKNSEQINRMKYLQADLINLQRQTDRIVSDIRNEIKLNWVMEVISIKEDLLRALESAQEKSILTDGLRLLETRIENDLRAAAVEAIEADIGAEFDPKYHEAVAFQETNDEADGSILSIVARGYTIDGKVVRPVLVEVARNKKKKVETTSEVTNSM